MDNIQRERARSLKFMQIVFAGLALFCLAGALAVSTRGADLGLPEASTYALSMAFLVVGIIDTALLFAWEHILHRMDF
jgi:hypothetical protein